MISSQMPAVTATAERPTAYYVPAAWGQIAKRLEMHGIALEPLEAPTRVARRAWSIRLIAA